MNLIERDKSVSVTSRYGAKYELFMVCMEILVMIIKCCYYIFESIIKLVLPPAEANVAGEIVLITGTGHGIGKHLAIQYSKLGSIVICVDINELLNNNTVKEIQTFGGKVHGFVCDVSNREAVFDLSQKIKTQIGNVNILINNAGIMPTHPLFEQSEAEIRRVFEINVFAHFWTLQAFLPQMIANNKGHIVTISSMCGLAGMTNLVPYCATKFALRGMIDALQTELRAQNKNLSIKFTNIYPYMVDTGLCKNPYIRFTKLMGLVKQEEAATSIVQAQRRGIEEISIPKLYFYGALYTRLFPKKCGELVREVLDCGVQSDLS